MRSNGLESVYVAFMAGVFLGLSLECKINKAVSLCAAITQFILPMRKKVLRVEMFLNTSDVELAVSFWTFPWHKSLSKSQILQCSRVSSEVDIVTDPHFMGLILL